MYNNKKILMINNTHNKIYTASVVSDDGGEHCGLEINLWLFLYS